VSNGDHRKIGVGVIFLQSCVSVLSLTPPPLTPLRNLSPSQSPACFAYGAGDAFISLRLHHYIHPAFLLGRVHHCLLHPAWPGQVTRHRTSPGAGAFPKGTMPKGRMHFLSAEFHLQRNRPLDLGLAKDVHLNRSVEATTVQRDERGPCLALPPVMAGAARSPLGTSVRAPSTCVTLPGRKERCLARQNRLDAVPQRLRRQLGPFLQLHHKGPGWGQGASSIGGIVILAR
jgi:hypothetical protein